MLHSIISQTNSLALKAVASVVIVVHHYTLYQGNTHDNLAQEFLTLVCGYIVVALFFFLSGYGLMESEKRKNLSIAVFIKRRLSRVYIPFVLTNVLLVFTLMFIGNYPISFQTIVAHTIGYHLIDSVTWFVPVTLLFYLFVLLLSSLHNRIHKALAMVLLCLLYIILSITIFNIPFYAYVSTPAFPLGYIASLYCQEICQGIKGAFRVVLLILCVGTFVFLSLAMMGHFPVHGHILHGIIALNNIALVGIVISTFAGKDYKWFHWKWLGDISYEVYLCHAKVFIVYIAITGTFATFCPLLLLVIFPIAFVVNKLNKVIARAICH